MIIVRIIGGLGNQMFQYAFYKNLETKYTNVKCDVVGYDKYTLHNGFNLEKAFNLKVNKASLEEIKSVTNFYDSSIFSKIIRKIIGEKASHINENKFTWDLLDTGLDLYIDGYWQSEKYFGEHEQLKNTFSFKKDPGLKQKEIVGLITTCNSVSLHVRRGDYIGNKTYVNLGEEYYNNSIALIQNHISDAVFFIFSDDDSWVKENHFTQLKPKSNIIFVEKDIQKPHNDMRLMALCKHNIIANSSFSWWGAWLNNNENKIVVAPKQWYNDSDMNTFQTDNIPTSWIKI
jgi:hypothetical protein